MKERLQKTLAHAGVASRRASETLITDGRVRVNGRVVRELGVRVDPDTDRIEVDGIPIRSPNQRTYVMLNKPKGVVSTASDPEGRPTVVDLVSVSVRVYPIGRLDTDSEGLILLTDDGELTNHLTHPRFQVEKEYHALLSPILDSKAIRAWREGVMLDGVQTAPALVTVLKRLDDAAWVRVVLREGRKRQIREVATLLGYTTRRLLRVREGNLLLGDLPLGEWRNLSSEEVASLRAHVQKKQQSR